MRMEQWKSNPLLMFLIQAFQRMLTRGASAIIAVYITHGKPPIIVKNSKLLDYFSRPIGFSIIYSVYLHRITEYKQLKVLRMT